MSLQMMIGGEGSHRSEYMYKKLIEESMAHPEQNFYLVVPEQYTMQTQMKMTELHPGHGVMNIDIVSFPRLAYRVFDEVGGIHKTILEDTGKSMVIRKLLSERKEIYAINYHEVQDGERVDFVIIDTRENYEPFLEKYLDLGYAITDTVENSKGKVLVYILEP